MAEQKKVLVLGRGTRAFLAVIRSLGRLGLDVHVAMCPPDDLALRSRYVKIRHEVPMPERGASSCWLNAMGDVLSRHRFSLVLPCDDQSMIPVQQHREALARLAPVYAYDPETYAVVFSKVASTRLAEDLGIPVPRRMEVSDRTTSGEVLATLRLPLVLKPPSSFSVNDLSVRREVVRVRTEAELEHQLRSFRGLGVSLAQENFIGIGVGVELLARNGEVLVAFQHERVHEPPEGGGSSYRRSVELDPEMFEASRRIMHALNYTGVAMVEFKLNRHTGEWVFIEINGRFWGSLPLAISAGVDFPAYLYSMVADGVTRFPNRYRVGVHSRSLVDDYHWFAANLAADHSDPAQITVPLASVAAELLNVFRGRERIDTFALDDMRPGLAELAVLSGRVGEKAFGGLKKRLKRWRRARHQAHDLRSALRKAKSIGFVCYGNICRSPFAEAYAQQALGQAITVWSSGIHETGGRPSPGVAVSAARVRGVDLEAHRSQVIDPRLVEETDLIFVFDEKNWDALVQLFPQSRSRLYFLTAATGDGTQDIKDPYGRSEAEFDRVYQQIQNAVDAVVRHVNGD